MTFTGDPLLFNLTGDITITSDLVFPGEDLTIVAAGDILVGPAAGVISTSSPTGPAGDITLIAGAQAVYTPEGARLAILGPSTSGGMIDLEGSKAVITTISATGGGAAGSGGDITMIAFAGSGAHSGELYLPMPSTGLVVTTEGSGSGSPGNVLFVGGSDMYIGSISATGGTGPGGNITVSSTHTALQGGAHRSNTWTAP